MEQIAVQDSDLGFRLTEQQTQQIHRGKALIQLRNGPFDLDLVFAPDGIERFEDARKPRIGARIKSRCHACCLSAWLKKEGKL
jgi:hypothetical protein